MYKYLLWDIDGTVLDFEAAEAYAIKTLFQRYGIGECTGEMLRAYSGINKSYWKRLEKKELTKPEILVGRFVEFFDKFGIDTTVAECFNEDYQLTLGDKIEFVENSKEILMSYKGKCVLVAVTNGTKTAQAKKLRTSGLDKIFDAVFISEDVGAEKPDIRYFEYVIDSLKIADKKEALIIGDSLTSDILGGITAGIDTCWYNPKHSVNADKLDITYEIDTLRDVEKITLGLYLKK